MWQPRPCRGDYYKGNLIMASLANCKDGSRRIQFFNAAGERRNITLPSCTDERAREIRAKVKTLNADAIAGQASAAETARWLARQDAVLYAKLAAVGLVPPREVAEPKALAEFLDAYIDSRGNKPTTITNLKGARRWLVEYFSQRIGGSIRSRRAVRMSSGPGCRSSRTGAYRKRAKRKTGRSLLHENTARRICGRAKQFFRTAVRKRLIVESPFGDMQGVSVQANKSREYFITRDEAAKVLDACPDAQWKLLFALSRYGGLRCPSEHLRLRWGDMDWKHDRFTVRSPKTEHHEGKASQSCHCSPSCGRT